MSPDPVWPGLFLPCSLPRLLSAAAGGGLEPSPARRPRGASPHRLLSYAKRRLSPPLLLMAHLEPKLQRQLDRARSADLVERVEPPVRAARPEAARQGLRRAAEERAGQVVVGIAEVRAVQDVEELSAEVKPNPLGEAKPALQPNI